MEIRQDTLLNQSVCVFTHALTHMHSKAAAWVENARQRPIADPSGESTRDGDGV